VGKGGTRRNAVNMASAAFEEWREDGRYEHDSSRVARRACSGTLLRGSTSVQAGARYIRANHAPH